MVEVPSVRFLCIQSPGFPYSAPKGCELIHAPTNVLERSFVVLESERDVWKIRKPLFDT